MNGLFSGGNGIINDLYLIEDTVDFYNIRSSHLSDDTPKGALL